MTRWARRGTAGVSLIEVLVALVLVSVLVIALVNGLLTSTKATGTSNNVQRVDAAVTSFGEALKQLPYDDQCPDPNAYLNRYRDEVASYPEVERSQRFGTEEVELSVDQVQFWSAGSFPATGPTVAGSFVESCSPDGGTQLITFTVTYLDQTSTAQIVKRNPYSGADVVFAPTTTIPPGQTPPVARCTASPADGVAPVTVSFRSDGSFDVDGTITDFKWEFPGGAIDTAPNVDKTFTTGGRIKAFLTVTDDDGLTSLTSCSVRVTGVPAVPTGLKVIAQGQSTVFSRYVDLGWDPVAGVDEYELDLDPLFPVFCDSANPKVTAPAATTRVTVSALCQLFTYDARIRARVGSQWSAWSPVQRITV